MLKRLLLYLVALAVLLAVAVSAGQWDKDTALLQEHADQISAYLEEQELDALEWVKANRAPLEAAAAGAPPKNWAETIESQLLEDYTLFVSSDDSILTWANNKTLPTPAQLKNLTAKSGHALLKLPSGWFDAYQEPFGQNTLMVLTPIRYSIDVAKHSGQSYFPAGKQIPAQIQIKTSGSEYAVQAGGKDFCWLIASGPVHAGWLQWMKFVFYGLFFVILFSLVNRAAVLLSERYFPLAGAALLVGVVGGAYLLNNHFNFTGQQFGGLSLFAEPFDVPSLIGKSLGDWLIYIGLFAWLMVFFHRHFRVNSLTNFPQPVRVALCVVYYLATMMSILVGVEILRRLVFYSGIEFDFDNILNSDWSALLAIGGVLLLMVGLFLFSHRMMMTVKRTELPIPQRGIALGVSAVVLFAVCAFISDDLLVEPVYIIALGGMYAAVFDAFVHSESPGFGWMACWLLIFSMFASLLLYHYNFLKDKEIRLTYAEALTNDRDTEAVEKQLPELLTTFRSDSQKLNVLLKPWPFKPRVEEIRDYCNQIIFDNNYLFQHYKLNVFAFDRGVEPILLQQQQGHQYVVQENWDKGSPLPGAPGIRFRTDEDGKFRYMMELPAQRMNDATQPAKVYCFLDHDYPPPARVYVQLFNTLPYKKLERLWRYDFAVLKNNTLVVEQGQGNGLALSTPVNNGEHRDIETSNPRRIDALYKSTDGQTIASVGRPRGEWYKQVYLFSMLFKNL